jgi:hypothetical protein
MTEIRSGFFDALDRIVLRGGAERQPVDLREDVPHPVRALAAAADFRERLVVVGFLSVDETAEVERVICNVRVVGTGHGCSESCGVQICQPNNYLRQILDRKTSSFRFISNTHPQNATHCNACNAIASPSIALLSTILPFLAGAVGKPVAYPAFLPYLIAIRSALPLVSMPPFVQ